MRYYTSSSRDKSPASNAIDSVLADVRTAFRRRAADAADVSSLLDLYGSITSLAARAQRIRRLVEAQAAAAPSNVMVSLDELTPDQLRELDGFHHELIEFGDHLSAVNLAAVDIYFPGLRQDLLAVTYADYNFDYMYANEIAPKHGIKKRRMPPTLATVLDKYDGDWGPQNIGGRLLWEYGAVSQAELDENWGSRPDLPSKIRLPDLVRILDLLAACRQTIGAIVRENWQFRDLIERPTVEGIRVEMTEYNITGSQVGAVGPNAHVHDVTLNQVHSYVNSFDPVALAADLDQLREELGRISSERDQYADLVAVSDAAADAREGKTTEALRKLSAVGKWTLDVATRIGVTVATEAIKVATGLA